jgi:hypothetical protein
VTDESFVELIEDLLPIRWTVDDTSCGAHVCLVCPCDHVIELDGECPNGHKNPLRDMGLIHHSTASQYR